MNYYKYHIFFCLNQRDDGEVCCSDKGAEAMFVYMKLKIKSLDLNGKSKVRINRAGCFDRCGEGPLLVIYPEATWYNFIDEHDIDEIVESHIQQGKIVNRLLA